MVLPVFLSEFIRDIVQESVTEQNKLLSIAPVKPEKKRLSQRELVEMYNRITEVPPSDLSGDSSAAVSQSRYVITQRSSPLAVLETSGNLEPHVDDSPDESLSADLEVVSEVGAIVNKFLRASCLFVINHTKKNRKSLTDSRNRVCSRNSALSYQYCYRAAGYCAPGLVQFPFLSIERSLDSFVLCYASSSSN